MNTLKKAEVFNKKLKKQKALKLDAYKESIIYLLSKDTSILSIQKYLLEKEKITVSYSTLYNYVEKISISSNKKIDSNINSKALFQQSNYEKIEEYKSTEDKVSVKDLDFGFDMNINREERTIDYWKIDVKTNF